MDTNFGQLMRSIYANMNGYLTQHLKSFGIKQGQLDYFLLITQVPGINQLEIAKQRNVGKASVTKAIKILETDGLVRREIDPADRRHFKCYATEKGKKHISEIMRLKESVEGELFSGFSESELEKFHEYLTRLHQNADRFSKR